MTSRTLKYRGGERLTVIILSCLSIYTICDINLKTIRLIINKYLLSHRDFLSKGLGIKFLGVVEDPPTVVVRE